MLVMKYMELLYMLKDIPDDDDISYDAILDKMDIIWYQLNEKDLIEIENIITNSMPL